MEHFSPSTITEMMALIGTLILIAGLLSGIIDRTGLPQVAVFLALGIIIGPLGLNLFNVTLDSPLLRIVATLSLILVLFTDAVSLKLGEIRRHLTLVFLVLGPGTLLSAMLISLAGWWLLNLSLPEAAILGAALASTDPILLRGLLRGKRLPENVRQALRLESGLNDAVLLPVVLVAMGFLGTGSLKTPLEWTQLSLSLFLLGPAMGIAIGYLAIRLLVWVRQKYSVRRDYESLYSLGVVFTAYAGAEAVHGSGFLAAFAAGITIAALDVELCDCFLEYGESTSEMALLFTFILFGLSLIWLGFSILNSRVLFFVILTLLLRPVAFIISLAGVPLDWRSRLLIAWFGPRGLSSLLLILLPVFVAIPGSERLFSIASSVVLFSILVHGGSVMLTGRGKSPAKQQEIKTSLQNSAEAEDPPSVMASVEIASDDKISIPMLQRLQQESHVPVIVLDARSERTYGDSNLDAKDAIRLLPEGVGEQATALGLPQNAWLIVFCACGNEETSLRVAGELKKKGWPYARALAGGWDAWKRSGLPVIQRSS